MRLLAPPLSSPPTSPLILSDEGQVLRAYRTSDDKWRLRTGIGDVPRHFIDMLIAFEDRRFYAHAGVDWLAVGRAGWYLIGHLRRGSGASTITMQVARLLEPRSRGVAGKLRQILQALQLERQLTKDQILELYLTLAPFGGNVEGVRAASLAYFGKEPSELDPGQSGLLIALAQAPARRRPDRYPDAAAAARDRVLRRAIAAGVIEKSQATAIGSPIRINGTKPLVLAGKLADRLTARDGTRPAVHTYVRFDLQHRLEEIARETVARWPRQMNAAILVIDNRDCAARAYIGSSDYLSQDNAGQFDHVRAIRSPGSTLKPLIYAMGFENLLVHPLSVTTDQPVQFEGYAPRNFSEGYQGDMTVREALIKSINTTAVAILSRIGPEQLATRLRAAGLSLRMADSDLTAGLAIGLGGTGISLEDLTRLYRGFASGGEVCAIVLEKGEKASEPGRIVDADAAWALRDILADVPPPTGFAVKRSRNGGRRIAYKTGTSYGFRDVWAIGFDQLHTVGVWLGRTDGVPTLGATGANVAAPVLFRAFDLLEESDGDVAGIPPVESVLARRVDLPERLRRFRLAQQTNVGQHLQILFPHDNSTLSIESGVGPLMTVPLLAQGGTPPYYWLVDGKMIAFDSRQARWQPESTGQFSLTVMDATGETRAVKLWIR